MIHRTIFHSVSSVLLALVLMLCMDGNRLHASDFFAHFARITAGEDFEKDDRTGDYPDLVVRLGGQGGRLVFWRGASYLPYWETKQGKWYLPELTARKGDGDAKRPDRVNTFSHVHLVGAGRDRLVVLWRYLPRFGGGNPHTGVEPTGFAEETFEITSDGKVTRILRPGVKKYDDWGAGKGRKVQRIEMTPGGIQAGPAVDAPLSTDPPKPAAGSPVKKAEGPAPLLVWHFDEAAGDSTEEVGTAKKCPIAGHVSLWRRGVSGTALQFDGYTSEVQLPLDAAPAIADGLTLSAWVAIGAYPWNWAPVVQRGDDEGYFLGVSAHGKAGFNIQVGGRWEELVASALLQRNRWYQLAGSYDAASGKMSLFVDGQLAASRDIAAGRVQAAAAPIRIGRGKPRRPTDAVRASTFLADYGFDGLIDEVGIYDRALTPPQIAAAYRRFRPADAGNVDMEHRLLPKAASTGRFGARYTHLKYYRSWDVLWRFGDWPDVVVSFDRSPARFVFWRGTGYIPMVVNGDEQWYSNEFNETWGRSGGRGCQEPMSDKESYCNHARILENTEARTVVQWRYPLKDVRHVYANWHADTGWADWADWYFTIYPDGVAAKQMHLWTDGPRNHEWHEAMAIVGPNQHPEQIINTDPALILAGLDGKAASYVWTKGPPGNVNYRDKKVHVVNYKSEYKPFTIGDFTGGDVYRGEVTPYSVFPNWNHWPVSQIPSDGRYTRFPDRASHSSLTHVRLPDYRSSPGPHPYQEKLLLEGMSNQSPRELALLARSWLRAPELKALASCGSPRYEPAERAYILTAAGPAISVRIEASDDRPLVNPCFVIQEWNTDAPAAVAIAGRKQPSGPKCRQGIVRAPTGRQKMVIWLEYSATQPTEFQFDGAAPASREDTIPPSR